MGETVSYVINPKPNYGFYPDTNIPRHVYKEEVEKFAKKYKNKDLFLKLLKV